MKKGSQGPVLKKAQITEGGFDIQEVINAFKQRNKFSYNPVEKSVRIMSISAQGLFNEKETVFRKELKKLIWKQEEMSDCEEQDFKKMAQIFLKTIFVLETFKTKEAKERKLERFYWISLINFSVWLKENGFTETSGQWFKKLLKEFQSEDVLDAQRIELCLQEEKRDNLLRDYLSKQRLQMRVGLNLCLVLSELGQHQQSLDQAKSICQVNSNILMATIIILLTKIKEIDSQQNPQEKIQIWSDLVSHIQLLQEIIKVSWFQSQKNLLCLAQKLQNELSQETQTLFEKEIDLAFFNNIEVLQNQYFSSVNILQLCLMSTQNYDQNFLLLETSQELNILVTVEKILYTLMNIYVLSTESRFIEQGLRKDNVFQRILQSYYLPPNGFLKSERYMAIAIELAFKFLPESYSLVQQVYQIFKRYEINREKSIPEDKEVNLQFRLLQGYKNGFECQSIIPLVPLLNPKKQNPQNKQNSPQDMSDQVENRPSNIKWPLSSNYKQGKLPLKEIKNSADLYLSSKKQNVTKNFWVKVEKLKQGKSKPKQSTNKKKVLSANGANNNKISSSNTQDGKPKASKGLSVKRPPKHTFLSPQLEMQKITSNPKTSQKETKPLKQSLREKLTSLASNNFNFIINSYIGKASKPTNLTKK